jgi:hypothetical protein
LLIFAANSLVGVNIKARIGLWLKCFPCDNIKMGSETGCFPVPVCADANTSLPSKMVVLLFCCIEKEWCPFTDGFLIKHQINLMS